MNDLKMEELKKCIDLLDDNALIKMLNEIHEWENTGILEDGLFKCLYYDYKDVLYITGLKNSIMHEAHKRFDKVVKVLMTDNPSLYIR